MQGLAEDRILGALLHRPAQVHHHDVVGDVVHHAQIVRDEEVGELELDLQLAQQVQDLRLDRDVERRDRLVRHHQLRPQHQGAGDGDALALAAREHVGIAVVMLRPQADLGHHRAHLLDAFRLGKLRVDHQRLFQNGADPLARVERAIGVLEHDLHGAAQRRAVGGRALHGVAHRRAQARRRSAARSR